MPRNPKITLIVPVYNTEPYIARCLDSVLAQTFTDWECVCVDDGSPDASGSICDEYARKDSRIRVIHQENAGVSMARNTGIAEARGEWLGFIDSDDWIAPETCAVALRAAEQYGQADLVMFDAQFSDGRERDEAFKRHAAGIFDFNEHTVIPFCGYIWNKIYRRSMVQDNGIAFPQGIRWGEDGYFAAHCYVCSRKIIWTPEKLYNYTTTNENSLTKTNAHSRAVWLENLTATTRTLDFIAMNGGGYKLENTMRRFKWCAMESYFGCFRTDADFDYWRSLFPEEQAHLVQQARGLKRLFYRAVLRRADVLARLMLTAVSAKTAIRARAAARHGRRCP